MKSYMTISEFASLRGVNINSIRYYEKLNILLPAWVDPQTGYRYYLPEQLVTLDIITLCIRLGIPLKDIRRYVDTDGKLDKKGILETGIGLMQEKITVMQRAVEMTAYNLQSMEENQRFYKEKDVYIRRIDERFLLAEPFSGNWDDLIQKEKKAVALFKYAQKQGMSPVFPAGILVHCDQQPVRYSFYVQVLHPADDPRILHIPKGEFACVQADLSEQQNILDLLAVHFPTQSPKWALVSNLLLNNLQLDRRLSEIQVEI